jgi:hypothetical protein
MNGKTNWEAITAIVTAIASLAAIAGLVITLWLDTSAVKRSTQTNDLQLLTQMHRVVTESSGQFYSKHRPELVNYLSGKKMIFLKMRGQTCPKCWMT